jgi:hypothetical protein
MLAKYSVDSLVEFAVEIVCFCPINGKVVENRNMARKLVIKSKFITSLIFDVLNSIDCEKEDLTRSFVEQLVMSEDLNSIRKFADEQVRH